MYLMNFNVTRKLLYFLRGKNIKTERYVEMLETALATRYESNRMLNVDFVLDGKKYYKSVITDSSYGLTTAFLAKKDKEIVIAKRILALNKCIKREELDPVLLHEILHLISQNDVEKEGEYFVYKSGITSSYYTLYTHKDEEYAYSKNNLNEGITQYLTEEIYLKTYGKNACIKGNFSSVYAIRILNKYLKKDINYWLNIYLNNDYKTLIKDIEENLKISEKFLMSLNIGILYNEKRKKELQKLVKEIKLNI